jgi:hypothetical protein
MNVEIIKKFAAISNELSEAGVIGISLKKVHVRNEALKGYEDLQIRERGTGDYPFEVFVNVDGVEIFALIKVENIKDFPQFKKHAKVELLKQLAELEQEEEATA